jgi:CBS domain-containing protein
MTVAAILKQKGSDAVRTIRPDASLAQCASMLAEHRIGALIVSADGESIAGIISERDLVAAIARRGRDVLDQPVSTVMTRDVQTCALEERSLDLLQRMTSGRFRHLPVTEGSRLRAVVSIGDVVKFRISEIEMEKAALEDMVKGF